MQFSITRGLAACAGLALLVGTVEFAQAQEGLRHRDRPLTVTRRAGSQPRSGVQVLDGGNRIVAWGGFGANGYGYGPPNSEVARRAARNASVRYRTDGVYGYGYDGLGGTFSDADGRGTGYNNPNYGNAFNGYTGYNGVPTALAFGPGFASRHITDSDDADNDDESGPAPVELGSGALAGLGIDSDE